MRLQTTNPWNILPSHSGLVSIKTHSLWASVSGPLRTSPTDPLLIFITGAGGASAAYIKLQQHLSSFVRVLFYDRAGYDRSTLPENVSSSKKIYAADTARDLAALLAATHLAPPYILVAHSYGGIIARAFLALHAHSTHVITGVLLLDAATEMLLRLFARVPPLELVAVAQNVDWNALTDLQGQSGMSEREYRYALEASGRCVHALSLEDTHESAHQLALRRQLDNQALGDTPLSVLRCNTERDFWMMYHAGVELGDGTQQERRAAREFMRDFGAFHEQVARAQCRLSRNWVYKYYGEWGHDLPIRKPEVVGEEVRKLLERVR
ncbi:alpha/beta-hydrolase, partial [Pyrenochaeta sp. DS3sAY3a]